MPITLARFVSDFARGLKLADSRRPRDDPRFWPGIGPLSEERTIELVLDEVRSEHPYRQGYRTEVPYAQGSKQKCDLCLGCPPRWDWAIEVKPLRMKRNNGCKEDAEITHILSPYEIHGSALVDCERLARSRLSGARAVLIYGFDYPKTAKYPELPLDPAIEAFEVLSRLRVQLGSREVAAFESLVHPVHQRGRVFVWEVKPLSS